MALHSDQEFLDIGVGNSIRLAGQMGLLTDANVTGAANVADLKNSIDTNAATLHSDAQTQVYNLKRALDIGKDSGVLNDTDVAAAASLEALALLTGAAPGHYGPPIE